MSLLICKFKTDIDYLFKTCSILSDRDPRRLVRSFPEMELLPMVFLRDGQTESESSQMNSGKIQGLRLENYLKKASQTRRFFPTSESFIAFGSHKQKDLKNCTFAFRLLVKKWKSQSHHILNRTKLTFKATYFFHLPFLKFRINIYTRFTYQLECSRWLVASFLRCFYWWLGLFVRCLNSVAKSGE